MPSLGFVCDQTFSTWNPFYTTFIYENCRNKMVKFSIFPFDISICMPIKCIKSHLKSRVQALEKRSNFAYECSLVLAINRIFDSFIQSLKWTITRIPLHNSSSLFSSKKQHISWTLVFISFICIRLFAMHLHVEEYSQIKNVESNNSGSWWWMIEFQFRL